MKKPDYNIREDIDICVDELMTVLFSKNLTHKRLIVAISHLHSFIGRYQMLFFYHLAPPVSTFEIIKNKALVKNIYLLRLIKKHLDKDDIVVGIGKLKIKYHTKFDYE